jgi:hypothetical protein
MTDTFPERHVVFLTAPAALARALRQLQSAVDRHSRRCSFLEGLQALLTHYIPGCFILGWMVRSCYWEHRDHGSGDQARQALLYSLVLLLDLQRGLELRSEYIRSILAALLTWTPWHDRAPACLFVEEVNEALLSRLASSCLRHPNCVGADEVEDLFVLLQPKQPAAPRVGHHSVTLRLTQAVAAHLGYCCATHPDRLSHTPWRSQRVCVAEPTWANVAYRFPSGREVCSPETLGHVVTCVLRRLVQTPPPGPRVVRRLDAHVDRCTPHTVNTTRDTVDQFLLRTLGATHNLPRAPPQARKRVRVAERFQPPPEPPRKRQRAGHAAPPPRLPAHPRYVEELPERPRMPPPPPVAVPVACHLVGIPDDDPDV